MAQLIEQPLEQRDDSILKAEHHEPFDHNLVDGIMVPSFITQQRVDELKTLKLRPDDVFVKVARHGLGSVTSGDVLLALGLAALRSRLR